MRIFSLALILALLVTPAWAQEDGDDITDIKPVVLHAGVNDIPHMAPDGRDGEIFKAWRTDGNAMGHTVYLTAVDNKVVGIATDHGFEDVITDMPLTATYALKSVRFAWASIGKQKAFICITATRMLKAGYHAPDPAITMFDIYKLVTNGDAGTSSDFFERIKNASSAKKYCNSDLALYREMGMPLPEPFEGPNKADGCL